MSEKKNRLGWDGRSRPSNNLYEKNYKRIFGDNSKDSENDDTVKTSQYNNKVYDEKQQKNKKKNNNKYYSKKI